MSVLQLRRLSLWQQALIVGGASIGVLIFVVLVVKVLPEALAGTAGLTPEAKAEEVGRTRTAVLAMLAGGIAVVGAVYTARTFGLNRRAQVTDRFIHGLAQLGDDSVGVRVGGIYALGAVAGESRHEHRAVMEALLVYAHENSRPVDEINVPGHLPADLRAAVIVFAGRNRDFDDDDFEIDLGCLNLSYLTFPTGIDLRNVNLTRARLDHAVLRQANLSGATLNGANLEYARLDGVSLVAAEIYGANLEHAELVQADLRWAKLSDTNLLGAGMAGADLRATWFMSYFGSDRSGEIVGRKAADLGTAGAPDATYLTDAVYDELTKWPNLPSAVPFDADARGAKMGKTTHLGEP